MEDLLAYLISFILAVLLVFVIFVALRFAISFTRRKKVRLEPRTVTLDRAPQDVLALMTAKGWVQEGLISAGGGGIYSQGPLKVTVSPAEPNGVVIAFLGLVCDTGDAPLLQSSMDSLCDQN